MIQLTDVIKKYGEYTAVNKLSLKIDKGEIIGLLGPNGAGKSTTMKIMAGYLVPDFGTVEIDGKNFETSEVELKKIIGYMPENNPLYKEMKVNEALRYAAVLNGVTNLKERMDFVIKATSIDGVLKKTINELSKGYKQRVGLAIALIHDPKILILDEPTEGLDPNQRNEIRNLIRDLGKERTVIISTHVLQEVEAMCNRIIIVNQGVVVLDDSKDNILKRADSTNEFTISFKPLDGEVSNFENDGKIHVTSSKKTKNDSTYNVIVDDAEEFITLANSLVKKNKILITELTRKQNNLEEIFRQLTVKNQ